MSIDAIDWNDKKKTLIPFDFDEDSMDKKENSFYGIF